jgi:MOSC domain-containing protein YiiM
VLTIAELMKSFPATGELVWIGLRPARNQAVVSVDEAAAEANSGLEGDRYRGTGSRQVTLMQWEHLAVLSLFLGKEVQPEMLRRNLVIRGINLISLKDRKFRIGAAVFQTTGPCSPCSRMERILGPGGYNAMRGHGGLTARIVRSGIIRVGDRLSVLPDEDPS